MSRAGYDNGYLRCRRCAQWVPDTGDAGPQYCPDCGRRLAVKAKPQTLKRREVTEA